ncbi:MAG: HlyD family type I secretion periplasmic adaptor subunit, partial [Bradyrhizobium sp.]
MKHVNDLRPFDDDDFTPPPSRHVGPQGDALILELQRLQRAFEDDNEFDRTGARQGRRSPAGRKASQKAAKKSKKSKVSRAFDGWLQQFGFRSSPAPQPQ